MAHKIGRFFAESWQSALANEGMYYTPPPTVDMPIEQLNDIKTKLEELIAFWTNQASPLVNTAPEAIANAQAIADLEAEKLKTVNSIIQLKLSGGDTTTSSDGTLQQETTPTEGNNWLLWLALAVGGVIIIRKIKKKRKGRRRRR